MSRQQMDDSVNGWQIMVMTLLRAVIGWHFLYEGLVKILDTSWTAQGYLAHSNWIFSDLFHSMAANPKALAIIDFANAWGLTLIGGCLLIGLFTRLAAFLGVGLLVLYYVSNPPFMNPEFGEGSYLFVDKNLVEAFALLVVLSFPAAARTGIDGIFLFFRQGRIAKRLRASSDKVIEHEVSENGEEPWMKARRKMQQMDFSTMFMRRRDLLKCLSAAPFAGIFVWSLMRERSLGSMEEKALVSAGKSQPGGITGATIREFSFTGLDQLKEPVPASQLQDIKLSRMILGGNLMGGWAHARDLIYVSKLVKAYHHQEKVFETFYLAEKCGINAILTNPVLADTINTYWNQGIGNIQFISDCALNGDLMEGIRVSVDKGAQACYVQGGIADALFEQGKIDEIGAAVEEIRKHKIPAGIGAHKLETIQACVDAGFKPDFWMKTLHKTNYWSSDPDNQNDNIWCTDPGATVTYMNELPEPWIAFKILAAGALQPQQAFRYAFESGADFICVGMYDFQIVDDANIASSVLKTPLNRKRPWRA
jgi:uncharacterized membrane protein YphA (DoxX/SURF4 family)